DVDISGIRETAKLFRILLVLRKELRHLVRLGVSRRGKEERVDQAKHGRVHANAEREHSRRCYGEPRRLEQLPYPKFKISNHNQALWLSAIIGSARLARSAGM